MSLAGFDITPAEIADLVKKWGPAVLRVVADALSEGLTWALVKEALEVFGPLFLANALHKRRRKAMTETYRDHPAIMGQDMRSYKACCRPHELREHFAKADHFGEPIIQGEQVDNFDDAAKGSILIDLIIKSLPAILEKYGPQLMQLLIDAILKYLQNSANHAVLGNLLNEVAATALAQADPASLEELTRQSE
jgi:hypothetical protein